MNDKRKRNNRLVYIISVSIIIIITAIAGIFPKTFGTHAQTMYDFISNTFGWLFLLIIFILDIFLISLAASRYGRFKLGDDNEKPEFSFMSWLGMLFSAGLGVGIVFWGVAEPLTHYLHSPFPGKAPDQSPESARLAMGYTFFHWGISQWSIFAMAGLIVAYFQFRKKRDGLISTAMEPVFGEAYKRPFRNIIDILAIIATVMGIATSIGLGIMQISGGLNHVFQVPNNNITKISITVLMMIIFIGSGITGLGRGVKWLSNLNIILGALLLVFMLIFGDLKFIFESYTLAIGDYLRHFIEYSLRIDPYTGKNAWIQQWTVFYWAWVISWSPFIGGFVARVSRGRTIREFIMCVLIVPPLISFIWICGFGGMALKIAMGGDKIANLVDKDYTIALFELLSKFPLADITSGLAIILIFLFIVTSADSTTHIVAGMATGGSENPKIKHKVIWGLLIGAISVAMTIAGGLTSLQTASVVTGLPFSIILLLMTISIMRALRREHTKHFQMSYINDDKDYSIPLEKREKDSNPLNNDHSEKS
ncbi:MULTISPECIES: BCCT family transporter [Staphylococcus]|uniref:BCCT family transporter n=1 Tax=Staphylococcus TaxID=1279 RepID=UPI0007655B35|nr:MULTISPECIES: BCCT family transporter [Staphylococcus]MDU7039281.1 BCCT family transporter [Lactococcus lactis]MBS6061050.1 BCCT family transporter [Staphylococcus sp.]MDU1034755.1 BCCT family transporter [Staphylococcus sp.]MDU1749798.1 BCCT family transporter [Staphylococcus sp.]MDU1857319.1 BCCT family transporter [Staphylococcus sp.]